MDYKQGRTLVDGLAERVVECAVSPSVPRAGHIMDVATGPKIVLYRVGSLAVLADERGPPSIGAQAVLLPQCMPAFITTCANSSPFFGLIPGPVPPLPPTLSPPSRIW